METTRDNDGVGKNQQFIMALPMDQGIILVDQDSSINSIQSEMPLCPAYHVCKELNYPSSFTFDDNFNQQDVAIQTDLDQYVIRDDSQVSILRHLLQPIKETALRLRQLAANEVKQDGTPLKYEQEIPHFSKRCDKSEQNEINIQQHDPKTRLIFKDRSSSICVLCGTALNIKNPSVESKQLGSNIENGEIDNRIHYATPDDLDNVISKLFPFKSTFTDNTNKNNDTLPHVSASQCPPFKKNNNIDISATREKEETSPDTTKRGRSLSKFLFERRLSANEESCHTCPVCKENPKSPLLKTNVPQQKCDTGIQVAKHIGGKNSSKRNNNNDVSRRKKLMQQIPKILHALPTVSRVQDASTLTNEMFCPCACGLLVGDGTESEISSESLSMLKELMDQIKSEKLGHDLKENDDQNQMIKEIEMQKFNKDIEHSNKMAINQLYLQIQAEKLQKNIQFFKEENEHLRYLMEKYSFSLEERQVLQLSPTITTYSKFTTAFKFLRSKYHSRHEIITTLTEILRRTSNGLPRTVNAFYRVLVSGLEQHYEDSDSIAASTER